MLFLLVFGIVYGGLAGAWSYGQGTYVSFFSGLCRNFYGRFFSGVEGTFRAPTEKERARAHASGKEEEFDTLVLMTLDIAGAAGGQKERHRRVSS